MKDFSLVLQTILLNIKLYPVGLSAIDLLIYDFRFIDDGSFVEFFRVQSLVIVQNQYVDLVHVFELLFTIVNAVRVDCVTILLDVVVDVVAGCNHSL